MQTRKRVLINAFTVRALRDTFPPARGAGIRFIHIYLLLFFFSYAADKLFKHYLISSFCILIVQALWLYVPPVPTMTSMKLPLGFFLMLLYSQLILTGDLLFDTPLSYL